jgi:hypothetical protein
MQVPHRTGWYVAWLPVPGGIARRGEVVFCCSIGDVVRCNRPIGDPDAFVVVTDPRFDGVEWEGPFTLENLAHAAQVRGGVAPPPLRLVGRVVARPGPETPPVVESESATA